MTLPQQLAQVFFYAPLSLSKIRQHTALWMVIYLLAGVIVFASFSWSIWSNQISLKHLLLSYLFPQSWHAVTENFVEFLFESQAKSVITNLILSGSLVSASIFLFPIKEKFSAAFESDGKYPNGKVKEFPLIEQAWEEFKLLVLYLAAQLTILWIGFYPYPFASWTSIILSYLFLFFTFGLDFISPTLQRHQIHYTTIIKRLSQKLLLTLSFGAIFSLPVIFLSHLIFSQTQLTLIETVSVLFLVNLIFLTLAVPVGTHLASHLLPLLRTTKPPTRTTVRLAHFAISLLLIVGLTLHSKLLRSMHHKSQLLKAEYRIDWSSFDYQLPSFSELVNGKGLANLSLALSISNPTEFDIAMEKSRILLTHHERQIAVVDLTGFEIPAQQSREVLLKIDSTFDLTQISDITSFAQQSRIDLQVMLFPGIPLIINLL